MKGVKVSVNCSSLQFAKAYREYLCWAKISNEKEPVLMFVIAALTVILVTKGLGGTLLWIAAGIVDLILLVRIYYLYVKPILLYRRIPAEERQITCEFYTDRIFIDLGKNSKCVSWSIFSDVLETDDNFFLIQPSKAYTLIPKRCFETQEDTQEFKRILDLMTTQKKHGLLMQKGEHYE